MPLAAFAETGHHVLVLFSNARLLPANIATEQSFRETLLSAAPNTEISTEFLDFPRFSGPDHVANLKAYVKRKYAERPPDVLVAAGGDALRFLHENQGEMFPAAPLVHIGVLTSQLDPRWDNRAVGVPIKIDAENTIEDALRLHPKVEQVLVITGSSPIDRSFEQQLRKDLERFVEKTKLQFLAGLPTKAVLQRLSELDERALVFTPGYFRDGEGRDSFPKETIDLMARAANAPIYVPFDTFLGTGVVGGRMASFHDVGNHGAKIVARVFARANAQELDLPPFMPTQLHVDWRQLARWDIDPSALPADTIEHFRQPGYWEEHYREVLIAFTIVAFQAALISLLLLERHRRHRTEAALQKNRFELAHASRLAIAGELTGSITHEISQPLGAILSNAAAGELMLQSGAHDTNALRDILQDIQRDDIRASQVMRRLRALLQKHEVDHAVIDLNEVLSEVADILRAEALRRNVALTVSLAQAPADIKGDRVQIQQVLINLVLNALDSVMEVAPVRRQIHVGLVLSDRTITVKVQDRGVGIPPENVTRVFDSFFTTKAEGIGLGLSIVRTIIEAHGGKIGVQNLQPHGAVFHIDLPRLEHKAPKERTAG